MRHDPDIVSICHVAMSSPTLNTAVWKVSQSQREASGFSDSISTLRCFLWLWFRSIFQYYHLSPTSPQPFSLCSHSLTPAPAWGPWGSGFTILSLTLIQSLIRKGLPIPQALPLFFQRVPRALPQRPCSPPPWRPFHLYIFLPSGLFSLPFSLLLHAVLLKTDTASLIEILACRFDLIPWTSHLQYNMLLTYCAPVFHLICMTHRISWNVHLSVCLIIPFFVNSWEKI